jgi:hypothetical protein
VDYLGGCLTLPPTICAFATPDQVANFGFAGARRTSSYPPSLVAKPITSEMQGATSIRSSLACRTVLSIPIKTILDPPGFTGT